MLHTKNSTGAVAARLTSWKFSSPVIVLALLVVWTALVTPWSAYGDEWAIWPAVLALPVACVWHVSLFVRHPQNRRLAGFTALCHLTVLFPVWLTCLALISKDSL